MKCPKCNKRMEKVRDCNIVEMAHKAHYCNVCNRGKERVVLYI